MKNLVVILLVTITNNLFSQQSDTLQYQYRIQINEITSTGTVKFVEEPLYDLFKCKPIWYEGISTFIFESKEDVKKEDVSRYLPSAFSVITSFNQEVIKPKESH